MDKLKLRFGIEFTDLYSYDGLSKIDLAYCEFLQSENESLQEKLLSLRNRDISRKDHAEFIIEAAPYLEKFLCKLFTIESAIESLQQRHDELANIHKCKKLFVQRRAILDHKNSDWKDFKFEQEHAHVSRLLRGKITEISFADTVMTLLSEKDSNAKKLEILAKYAAWACLTHEGKQKYKDWVLFQLPQKHDIENSLDLNRVTEGEIQILKERRQNLVDRDGFSLTSKKYGSKEILDQTNYCIHCHKTEKDSCSTGLKEKTGDGQVRIKQNIYGDTLSGCPLDEKISEMNLLKSNNCHIGSLAAAIIDNPMIAATGYRICNDCMKSCIYQKQDPVNVPQAETGILHDVLNLPWGFEIYRLLTQWNPLKIKDFIVKDDTGHKILVVGLGPAGFTLAHYLLTEGHVVVAIDGLKIEPIDASISGIHPDGTRVAFTPIKDINSIFEDLDDRVPYGFGGVAEYGITVRWDKNFLKVIRLILERNKNFRMYGGMRFGSGINYDSAFNLGFDHIALSIGAGKPNILDIPNSLALGVRTASDFLMSLQLTGAAKKSSIVNLQLRLPVVVVGGGLTAIDTATEAISYYVREVEKFHERYTKLVSVFCRHYVEEDWSHTDKELAVEFMDHAEMFLQERKLAKAEHRLPNFLKIISALGGVKVIYRKTLQESPSYRLNPEEVKHAFQEGIEFVENAIPKKIKLDANGHIRAMEFFINKKTAVFPAKTLLVATGTNPNTVLSREDPKHFELDGKYFKLLDDNVFISKDLSSMKGVTVFGDLHPKYKGNVVKAMASAKNNYKAISNSIVRKVSNIDPKEQFFTKLDALILATVHDVKILTPNIIEVIFRAPLAANEFKPGQFYKLQNYDRFAVKGTFGGIKTNLAMEGVALTGAWVDKDKGLISTIVLEMGGSSDLCRFLKKGEPVVLMGPTGSPTEIKSNETILLAGGGLGNAVLFSIGKAFRDAGSKVLYFAGYKKAIDRYKVADIEAAADQVVWCCDEKILTKNRPVDISFHGNIVDAISAYAANNFGTEEFDIGSIDRIISIGSNGMMEAVHNARKHQLQSKLKTEHKSIASINSPMQCMMKEICAQCLQKHKDPVTGLETYVYSCANQDQDTDSVDFAHLRARLSQNSLSEKLTAKWIDYSLKNAGLRGALKACAEA